MAFRKSLWTILSSLFVVLGVPATAQDQGYITTALKGDLSSYLPQGELDPETAQKFYARFILQTDGLALSAIDDGFVLTVAEGFQKYWRDAMLRPESREAFEEELRETVRAAMEEIGDDRKDMESLDYLTEALIREFKERGYGTKIGKTPPLLQFIAWRKVEITFYDIELTDGVQEFPVFFLSDFLSRGWTYFATLDKFGTGGWATEEGVFAIKESYDLDSEFFKVSLLKHEARHFADKKLFPALQIADREYRAKLTELSFADETSRELLGFFRDQAARLPDVPHSLAAWYVIEGFKEKLFDRAPPDDEAIAETSVSDIQKTARALLREHTDQLLATGPDKAVGIINP